MSPAAGVRAAMELQAEAERRKRAQILESEGARQSKINVEEGNKAGIILASEAAREDSINRAVGAPPIPPPPSPQNPSPACSAPRARLPNSETAHDIEREFRT